MYIEFSFFPNQIFRFSSFYCDRKKKLNQYSLRNYVLDEMNFLKVLRSTIHPQRSSWIPMRITYGSIRLQTTDAPTKEEPKIDVSTDVKQVKQSNLMEFFDISPNVYESKIVHGK